MRQSFFTLPVSGQSWQDQQVLSCNTSCRFKYIENDFWGWISMLKLVWDFGNWITYTLKWQNTLEVCLPISLDHLLRKVFCFPYSVSRTPFKSSCKIGCHPFWSQLFTPTFPVKNVLMQTTWSTYQVSRLVNSSSQFVLQREHVILQKYVWLSFRILFIYASLWCNCLAPPFPPLLVSS